MVYRLSLYRSQSCLTTTLHMHRSCLKAWISPCHVIPTQLSFSSQQPKWHLFWHPKNPQAGDARILVWDQRMISGKGAIGLENEVPDPDVWRKDYRALQIYREQLCKRSSPQVSHSHYMFLILLATERKLALLASYTTRHLNLSS